MPYYGEFEAVEGAHSVASWLRGGLSKKARRGPIVVRALPAVVRDLGAWCEGHARAPAHVDGCPFSRKIVSTDTKDIIVTTWGGRTSPGSREGRRRGPWVGAVQ